MCDFNYHTLAAAEGAGIGEFYSSEDDDEQMVSSQSRQQMVQQPYQQQNIQPQQQQTIYHGNSNVLQRQTPASVPGLNSGMVQQQQPEQRQSGIAQQQTANSQMQTNQEQNQVDNCGDPIFKVSVVISLKIYLNCIYCSFII